MTRRIIATSPRMVASLGQAGWTRVAANQYGAVMESPGAETCEWCELVDPVWEDGCTEEGCGYSRA